MILKDKKQFEKELIKYQQSINEITVLFESERTSYDAIKAELNQASMVNQFKSEKDRKAYYKKQLEELILEETALEREMKKEDKRLNLADVLSKSEKNHEKV
jgi:hypothetical protein